MAERKHMGFFERYLTLWVAICIAVGTFIGSRWPGVADWLDQFTVEQISLPVAVLIWLMIYPMMLQIDFASLKRVGEKKQGLVVTTVTNWLIKPFTMDALFASIRTILASHHAFVLAEPEEEAITEPALVNAGQ